ncbi:hypothetical protein [Escherichia coli]|nr:hypothetical protein [Escherichia coli]HCB2398765.1 hypothetical protein [Escherichia coli]
MKRNDKILHYRGLNL